MTVEGGRPVAVRGVRRVRAMIGAVCAVAVLFGGAACTDDPAPENTAPMLQPGKPGEDNKTLSPEEAKSAAPAVEPNAADVEYVTMMIVHHQQAVEMTALAPTRAANEQVKGLASRISDTQGPEIDMMNRWLRDKGKPEVKPSDAHGGHGGHGGGGHGTMPGMATPEQMAQLAASSGAAYDTLFLQLMIRHHEGAIEMANKVQNAGVDVKVQEMADHVVAEQSDEIRRMRTMLGA